MPPMFEQILPHFAMWVGVLARLSGLFLFAPLLTSIGMPATVRALFAVAMALVVYPTINHVGYFPETLELVTLVPIIASELALGATIGLFVSIPLMAVQLAGLIIEQQMGLSLAEQFNPTLDISAGVLGQGLYMTTVASFIYIGGVEFMFGALVHTFNNLPVGGFAASMAPVDLFTGLLTSAFSLAFRVALPVLTIIALETVAIGFIMKTVPALNIMSVGFPMRILLGVFTYMASLTAIKHAVMLDMHDALERIEFWVRDLGAPFATTVGGAGPLAIVGGVIG